MDRTEFIKEEYIALKTEILERIRIMNSQGTNAIVTILTTWSIAIAFTVICYSREVIREPACRFILENIKNFIYLIPIFFFIPLSIKSGENLRQLASLSAYIKVFYEFPMLKGGDNAWETYNTMLSNITVDKGEKSNIMKRFNGEYSILASISLIIFALNVMSTGYIILSEKIELCIGSICIQVWTRRWIKCYFLLYLVIGLAMIFIISAIIHRTSCAKVNGMDAAAWYLGGYIELAKQNGLLREWDYEKIYQILRPNLKIAEEKIRSKVEGQWKYTLKRFR